jgi:NAD(P)-dependent dehydrogenase (short-subunit alcohol dehydrogenase family)
VANLFDPSGRVAIVTSPSRGSGRAIAARLAEHGASVVISSRKAEARAETATAINRALQRDAAQSIAG